MELLESMAHCVVTEDYSLHPYQGGTFTNKLTNGDKNGPDTSIPETDSKTE